MKHEIFIIITCIALYFCGNDPKIHIIENIVKFY